LNEATFPTKLLDIMCTDLERFWMRRRAMSFDELCRAAA
jgi:hypothetical protein